MTTIPQALMLLALDDEKGTVSARTSPGLDHGLAGGALVELVFAQRIEFADGRIVVRDPASTGDAVLDKVLGRLAERDKPRKPADWVGRLSHGIRKDVLADLQERGVLSAEHVRRLGILNTTRYPEADPSVERAVRERVRAVLVDGAQPDAPTGALIAIADAASFGRALVADRPWSEIKPRVKQVAEGDWAAAAVRKAIQSVNAAVMAAIVATSTVTAGSS